MGSSFARCLPTRLKLSRRPGDLPFARPMLPVLRCRLQGRGYADLKDVPPEPVPGKRTTIVTPTTIPTEIPSSSTTRPNHQRLGPLTSAFNAYSRSQSRSPLSTQFWSAVVIYLLADISAQTLSVSEDSDGWDTYRTARNLLIGGIVSIPGYKW